MKLSKLYIKIFLSFLLVLIVTLVLIFAIFVIAAGRDFHSRMGHYVRAHVLITKELVEDKIKSNPGVPVSQNEDLRKVIGRLGRAYSSKVWLTGADGKPLMKSFSGDIPKTLSDFRWKRVKESRNFELYRRMKRGWQWYAIIPTRIQEGQMGRLHLFFERPEKEHPEGFGLALIIIGIVIALLVLPISRYITKRVKGLSESASRIAEGDLSHRATVKGKDEIGELGRTFNRMAAKLERMIQGGKELTANVSHELRTPLARIRVAEELLREKLEKLEKLDNQDLDRYMDDIREDIEELDGLIGQILDLSKMDLHDAPLNLEILDPSELINELLGRLENTIKRRGLNLTRELSFEPPFIADKGALRTALSNILENAVKFSPEKGDLSVKMRSENGWLHISVTNSSDPMSEEDLERIFEPFYRTEEALKKGSGLGLAITKKIVERHGGNIKAVNTEQGLQIQIRLLSGGSEESP
ncbi:MAG: HAMP domain-containing sensor histidine kinase [Desulfobacteraceae bacterium]|jgi:two-component system sensor histidine kinase CpxA